MSYKTTHIGSLPRPGYDVPKDLDKAVEDVVRLQVETGIEEVNDGEYRRSWFGGDISALPGFLVTELYYENSAGDRWNGPIVQKLLEYDPKKPLVAEEVNSVKKALEKIGAKRRIKTTVPSPTFLAAFYPDESWCPAEPRALLAKYREKVKSYYPTVDDFIDAVSAIVVNEIRAAFDAGADTVQLDAPDILQWAIYGEFYRKKDKQKIKATVDLINDEVLSKVPSEKMQVHSCFGNAFNAQFNTLGHYGNALPELYELKAGVIGPLEVFDGIRDFDELKYFKEYDLPRGKRLGLGIVSPKYRNVEPVELVKKRYQAALDVVGGDPEKLVVAPGCGFASGAFAAIVSLESARRKLANLVKAVKG